MQQLEALIKMAPTKDEVEKLEGYDGDVGSLVAAERLVKVVLTIPCAFARVEAMLYRETFADEVSHIRKSFAMLEVSDTELLELIALINNLYHDQIVLMLLPMMLFLLSERTRAGS